MNTLYKLSIALPLSLLTDGIAMTAWAEQGGETTTNPSLSPLFACMLIEPDNERLKCQDVEIQKLLQATESKKLVIINEETAKDIKKKSFGLSLPKLGLPSFKGTGDSPKVVFLPIDSIEKTGRKLTFTMQNGQVWQTTNSDHGRIPKSGDLEAKIKSAAFGSFLMSVTNGTSKSTTMRVKWIE